MQSSRSSTVNDSVGAMGNTRRAFQDVTNANRRKAGSKATKGAVAKRSTSATSMPAEHVKKAKRSNKEAVITSSVRNASKENDVSLLAPSSGTNQMTTVVAARTKQTGKRVALQPRIAVNPNSYQFKGIAHDIDSRDKHDALCVPEYVEEIYEHFRKQELTTCVDPDYMEHQPQINHRMRTILVDWLYEVHHKFKLMPETLYLTINLIDRYLARMRTHRGDLQLVGITCLLIAAKYEEIYYPEIKDLVYICDHAYTSEDFLYMETYILKVLEYKVTISSAHTFLVRFLKAAHADRSIVQMSCYLLDGCLQSPKHLEYKPSELAAAVVWIARRTVGRNAWSPTLLKYAQYYEEEIIPLARVILSEKAKIDASELHGLNKKYSGDRYGNVPDTVFDANF